MDNVKRIVLSSIIVAIVISLLFIVVPITEQFIVSYIFALIAIIGIATSLILFDKGKIKPPQGTAFIYVAVIYAIISVIFSVIACISRLSINWTLIIHIVIFAIPLLVTIALSSGNEYINKVEESAKIKHEKFKEEKKKYWN